MSHKAAKVDGSPLLIDLYKWNARIPECSSIIHALINMEIHSIASPGDEALRGDLRSCSAILGLSTEQST